MTDRVPVPAGGGAREAPLRLFLVAGEHSGDALGAKLMAALARARPGGIQFSGVGGPHMSAEGLSSLFPIADVAVMGPLAIARALPRLYRRVHQAVDAAIAARPDVVVVIDSPEFTHPIARRIRKRVPGVPIVDYVSPSVWAWRPGRARRMRAYVDHVLALLPFEPAVHERLGGPPCTYVGHPLAERVGWMEALDPAPLARRLSIGAGDTVLVVLPGSRHSEIERLLAPFGAVAERLAAEGHRLRVLIPAVDHVRALVAERSASWRVAVDLVDGEDDKFRAFKLARAALAASGTVTLELGLAGTPMVVGYRVDPIAARLRFLVKAPHFALANLVLGARAFPELMQEACEPAQLASALAPLLDGGPERSAQLAALARIPGLVRVASGSPSDAAARVVLGYAERRHASPS